MTVWHLLTPEYPPAVGGVSDHTRWLAHGLADVGDEVHVWCPDDGGPAADGPVTIHRCPGRFGRSTTVRLDKHLGRDPRPRRLLVQWVPQGYGWRAMNLGFCIWVWGRAERGDRVDLMAHEVRQRFGRSPRSWPVAAAHRLMARILVRAADRVWCASDALAAILVGYLRRGQRVRRLAVPSAVPGLPASPPPETGEYAVGHFSAHNGHTTRPLRPILEAVLATGDARVLLIGNNGPAFRDELVVGRPDWAGRVDATGPLPLPQVRAALFRCRVLVQPVLGGVTARNTSVLAGLCNARPVVSALGPDTEPFWRGVAGPVLVSADTPNEAAATALRLAADPAASRAVGDAGHALYVRACGEGSAVAALREGWPPSPDRSGRKRLPGRSSP